jgi:ATP-dependent exoDNAse (exonuclease V) beta subunit
LALGFSLRPVVYGVGVRPPGEAALVVVADPKQSIYGWRGADPRLLERMDRRYELRPDRLDRSWRSSPVVLDFVDDVFRELPRNPVVESLDQGPEVARVWSRSFSGHRPAPPRADDAGHVVVEVGPRAEGRGDAPPEVLARAAERVAELHRRAPHVSVGVLTRTNRAVRRLIRELRHRGVDASEEGGTPVSDVAPVAALLSLLRMADHPGDRVARYHVARTPVGAMIGYRDHADGAGARRVSREVRRRLLRDGYGDTLAGWVERLAPSVDRRELRRLGQLVELGFRWTDGSGLRPGDFVRYAESERVEDPSAAPVRVMTVHQAKGLEFDAVVLPELGASLTGRGGEVVLPERDPETGLVQRVFPGVKKSLRPLFPELAEAHRQQREAVLRDAFSLLYVALTRARRAVHVVLDGNDVRASSTARRFSRLLLASFGLEDVDGEDGEVLLERGDPRWHEDVERPGPSPAREPAPGPGKLRIDPGRSAGRVLRHRSPSDLADGGEIRLDRRLELGTGARRRGRVVHEWLRAVEWLEEGLPGEEELRRIAGRTAPGMEPGEMGRLLESLSRWRAGAALRRVLSRDEVLARARQRRGPGLTGVEARNEWSFVHRVGDEVFSGRIDRLTVLREGGEIAGAEVVDYKVEARSGEAVESYAPQLRAYGRAVAALLGLDRERVRGRLVFLDPAGPGEAVEL